MADKDPKSRESGKEKFTLPGIEREDPSTLNDPVWRLITFFLGGTFLAWLLRIVLGSTSGFANWVVALVALASWITVVRMLMLVTKFWKFWRIVLVIGFVFLALTVVVPGFVYVSVSISFFFLLFRRYKPFRHLTSRRRAAYFMLALLAFGLLTIGFPGGQSTPPANQSVEAAAEDMPEIAGRFEQNLGKYSVWSLRFFYFLSLFNLFFAIRLQFMKIRPKLAVSSFLITVVPVFLVVLMGVLVIYSTLGLNRASRAQSILYDWASIAAQDLDFVPIISGTSFMYENGLTSMTSLEAKTDWFQEFLDLALSDNAAASPWAEDKAAAYLWADQNLWLVAIDRTTDNTLRISGGLVDEKMMNRLANILHSDVKLSLTNPVSFEALGRVKIVGIQSDEPDAPSKEIAGTFERITRPDSPTEMQGETLWQKNLYSGMSEIDATSLSEGTFVDFSILLLTEGSVESFVFDLISERNPLSLVVFVGLLVMGFLLLVLEAFALYFGVRITGGITSAVRSLSRGTQRVADGDLDAYIDIPNEDELGELAVSFNKMTAAIKVGQAEAIARQHLERELETAREIQEKLLPDSMPLFPGFEITGTNIPSLQVGGDYFDFIELESGHLGIAIGDVCGKGIPAALLMANLQAGLHGQAVGPEDIASVISRMNDLLVRSTDINMFATFFYGVLDRVSSTFTSTNAGHNPPLHFSENGEYKTLKANGMIIGFLPGQKYEQHVSIIEPGDVLVLYTDGITEAVREVTGREEDRRFGEDRLIEVVKKNLDKPVREIQSEILRAIADFTAGAPQNDDVTLVVIKRTKNP